MWKYWKVAVAACADAERGRAEVVRDSADHGVDRCSVGCGNVDSLVEGKESGLLEAAREHAVFVDGAGVAEETSDRMLLVEGSKRLAPNLEVAASVA